VRKPNGWHPPYDFQAALPYCVDAWPKAWRDLAPASEIIPLNREEMNALGSQIIGFGDWFTPSPARPLLGLARRLDAAIARLNRSCFVRLTSRSPKDSLSALRKGMKVADGAQALALFVEGSQRCAADLRMALDGGHELGLVVRRWVDFPPWAEFRCFMLARNWLGASQARHLEGAAFAPMAEHVSAILTALHRSMGRIVSASPVADAAFDLVFQPPWGNSSSAIGATLLDVNPLLDITDTALFSSAADFDLTFRFRRMDDPTLAKIPL